MIKVYFDEQIWALLSKGILDNKILEKAKESFGCEYYLSVAHLEELHSAEINETPKTKGYTKKQEEYMKNHAISGVIKETYEGVIFHPGDDEYKIARDTVWDVDTTNLVKNLSDISLDLQQKLGVDPKTLFEGMKRNPETEYKDIWELEIVKDVLSLWGLTNVKYDEIKNNYTVLESTITNLFLTLTVVGYKRDNTQKLHNSGEYDIQHAIRATCCDLFVTNDSRLKCKFKAIAYYLGIPIKVIDFSEFESEYGH